MKFTQLIKDNWLTALKSGEYTQTVSVLKNDKGHCCIGVLAEVTEGLSCNESQRSEDPYHFLIKTIGTKAMQKLWGKNDSLKNEDTPDYRNVIPLIEELKTKK
jgi:hypothetical protein